MFAFIPGLGGPEIIVLGMLCLGGTGATILLFLYLNKRGKGGRVDELKAENRRLREQLEAAELEAKNRRLREKLDQMGDNSPTSS
jgi:hypothetical protein